MPDRRHKAVRQIINVLPCILFAFVISGCSAIDMKRDKPYGDDVTVVMIGGANSTEEQFSVFKTSFERAVVVVPQRCFPLSVGAEAVFKQISDKGISGRLVLIGHSWGGLLARTIDIKHPGRVAAIVTIATPNGHFRFVPEYVANLVLRPSDSGSKTPLFVVAGVKAGADRRWWMQADESDGVIDVASAMATEERETRARAIFEGEHNCLLESPEVIRQVKAWLRPMEQIPRGGSMAARLVDTRTTN